MPTLPVGKAILATNRGRYSTTTTVGANRGTVLLLLVSTGEDILHILLYCRYQQEQIFYYYYSKYQQDHSTITTVGTSRADILPILYLSIGTDTLLMCEYVGINSIYIQILL
jgi:hypothetical protein